jgi:hypothetical protein
MLGEFKDFPMRGSMIDGGGHHRWRSFRESCDHRHVKGVNLLPETIPIIITGVIICHNDRI